MVLLETWISGKVLCDALHIGFIVYCRNYVSKRLLDDS